MNANTIKFIEIEFLYSLCFKFSCSYFAKDEITEKNKIFDVTIYSFHNPHCFRQFYQF